MYNDRMEEELLRRESGEKGEPLLARKIADTIIARWTNEAHQQSIALFLFF